MTAKEAALLASDIDTYGDLNEELEPFKSKIAARDKLRRQICARFDTEPADQACASQGERWAVKLSARSMKRVFKPGAIKRLATFLGDVFFKIADVSLKAFDDNVTINDRQKYVEEEQTGYRTIEAVTKSASARRAA